MLHSNRVPWLCLDRKHPGEAWVLGKQVLMPKLPYTLLSLLAETPGHVVAYETINERLWPDAQVEQQQIGSHARRALEALGRSCGRDAATGRIKTVRGQGLILALPYDSVRLVLPTGARLL